MSNSVAFIILIKKQKRTKGRGKEQEQGDNDDDSDEPANDEVNGFIFGPQKRETVYYDNTRN